MLTQQNLYVQKHRCVEGNMSTVWRDFKMRLNVTLLPLQLTPSRLLELA